MTYIYICVSVSMRQSEIEKLKNDIRQMEQDRRDEREGRKDDKEKKKKKVSLIEQQRQKYARKGAADIGGLKERKRRGEGDSDVSINQVINTIIIIKYLNNKIEAKAIIYYKIRHFPNC